MSRGVNKATHSSTACPSGEVNARLGVCSQILLTAALFGVETCVGFFQIYAILFLRYMGVPTSLISVDGIIMGAISLWLIPLVGIMTDRGANPKFRKMLAILLGMIIVLAGAILCFTTAIIKLKQLQQEEKYLKEQYNTTEMVYHYIHNSNTTPASLYTSSNGYMQAPNLTFKDLTNSTSDWMNESGLGGIPTSAILAILTVILLNVGFDYNTSTIRAYVLVCVPPSQQMTILVTGTILQSLSGMIFSILGVFDLPNFLGPLFGVDGISATFLVISSYIFIVTAGGSVTTLVTGSVMDHRLNTTFRRLSESTESDCIIHQVHGQNSGVAMVASIIIRSDSFRDESIDDTLKVGDNVPFLHSEHSKNKHKHYSTITYHSGVFESKQHQIETNSIYAQSTFLRGRKATQIRKNMKLIVLCMSYFFAAGGLVSYVGYAPNVLTTGIYHGDPEALPGTEGHTMYQKGLNMSAVGNLLFGITYVMMSIVNKVAFRYIGEEMMNVVLSTGFIITLLTFITTKHETVYFITSIFNGPFRTCIYTIVFMLATKYSQQNWEVKPGSEGHSNTGKVMSLIGILSPLHHTLLSTFMGPVMARTNNIWIPLYYSTTNFILAYLGYLWLVINRNK